MADIVISEFMDERVVNSAFAGRDVLFDPTLVDRPDDLHAELARARAIIVRNRTQVRQPLLTAAPNLKVVGRLGVGLDNIDMNACKARGVVVHPATGANDQAVAEYVITSALLLLRGAFFASERVASGAWPRTELIGRESANKVMGLIGFGSIARQTAARAMGLNMRVVAYDPFVPDDDPAWGQVAPVTLDALFETSDVISLHVPLTETTRHLVNAERLAMAKPTAVLINAARGGVIDESALIDALRAGRLGGAALDVFENEPVDASAGAAFASTPNLLLTPHIAGITDESNVRVSELTARNVLSALDG